MAPTQSNRIWTLRLLTLLVGVGLVAGAELLLRLVPGLGPAPLVVTRAEDNGKVLRSTNRFYSQRFFFQHKGRLSAAGKMAERFFVEPGPANRYRVVLLGASTVQGFPQPRRLAAAAFLEAMLGDALPENEVEVFNLGITSIASFAVAQVAEDAMALEPDLVVVYTGHNEFYGIYGVGDQSTPRYNRLDYAVRQLHLFHLVEAFVGLFKDGGARSADLVQLMAQRGEVALDSPRRRAAELHLRQNLMRVVQVCNQAEVPLVLCTLAANEAGFAPVGSGPVDLDGAAAKQWDQWVGQAARELTKDYVLVEAAAEALVLLEQAAALSADHAWLRYLQGRALERLGKGKAALEAYAQARDLDTMPWRGPMAHNEVIRLVAQETGVVLADVAAAFAAAAPAQGVGWHLMVDHVHFSVPGQALLARVILDSIERVLSAGTGVVFRGDLVESVDVYRRRLGDLPIERVMVAKSMGEMLSQAPMDQYNVHNGRYLKQLASMEFQGLTAAEQRGIGVWTQQGKQGPLALAVADLCFEAKDFRRAEAYYNASRLEAPYSRRGDLWAVVQWAWAIKMQDKPFTAAQRQQMRSALERATFLAHDGSEDSFFVDFVKGQLYHLLADHSPALVHLERAFLAMGSKRRYLLSLFHALAAELVRAERLEDARRYARQAGADSAQVQLLLQVVEAHAAGRAAELFP